MITDEKLAKITKTVNLLRDDNGDHVPRSMQETLLFSLIISDAIVEASKNIADAIVTRRS